MEIKFDSSQFKRIVRPYAFAMFYRVNHNITSKLKDVEIGADYEDRADHIVCIFFENEAHCLEIEDVARELNCEVAIIGTDTNGDYVICGR